MSTTVPERPQVCGILTEAVAILKAARGIPAGGRGLNLRPAEMPPAITDTVGSLACDAPLKNAWPRNHAGSSVCFPGHGAYLEAYPRGP
jgi:hypothetical protein